MSDALKLGLALILIAVMVIAPLLGQIFAVRWWLRRGIRESNGQPQSWIELQIRAFLFNVGCSTIEAVVLLLIFLSASPTKDYLGNAGLALEAIFIGYAFISFVAGVILASVLWWNGKHSQRAYFEVGS